MNSITIQNATEDGTRITKMAKKLNGIFTIAEVLWSRSLTDESSLNIWKSPKPPPKKKRKMKLVHFFLTISPPP